MNVSDIVAAVLILGGSVALDLPAGALRIVFWVTLGLVAALEWQASEFSQRTGIAAEASRGNAGALAFTDVLPLASPKIMRKAPAWLLDPLGPGGDRRFQPGVVRQRRPLGRGDPTVQLGHALAARGAGVVLLDNADRVAALTNLLQREAPGAPIAVRLLSDQMSATIVQELIGIVRDQVGPVANFRQVAVVAPTMIVDVRYATANNFTGTPLPGYGMPVLLLRREAALALACGQLAWQVWRVDLDDPADCLDKFRSNTVFGWLMLAAILLGRLSA